MSARRAIPSVSPEEERQLRAAHLHRCFGDPERATEICRSEGLTDEEIAAGKAMNNARELADAIRHADGIAPW